MSKPTSISLAGKDYPVGPFTLADMQRLLPQYTVQDLKTVEGTAAVMTILTIGVMSGNPSLAAPDIQAIKGVTLQELGAAVVNIGLICGTYVPKADEPLGDGAGVASP